MRGRVPCWGWEETLRLTAAPRSKVITWILPLVMPPQKPPQCQGIMTEEKLRNFKSLISGSQGLVLFLNRQFAFFPQ